jgi:RNA polymerase-binding transcription factor DksA
MATKKPAPKKATKPAKPVAKKPAPKPVAKKAAPAKKAVPAKATKPAAKKAAPVKKPVVKVPVKAAKPAPKPAAKKVAPVAKPVTKAPVKAAKPEPKPVAKQEVKKPVAPAKPEPKPAKVKAEKPEKPVKIKPAKAFKPYKPPKPVVKVSGIEKSTTVIPLKQLPMKKKEEPVKEMKAPKTTMKTSVPYNPGYTALEKRVDSPKTNEPLVRYSDADLNEFRELINKKLETSKKELAYLQGLITRKDETGGDNEDGRYMTMEDGSLSMEREQLSQMASRQITFIDHLEKAIRRIESKTYGICRVTGKLIDKARLRAVPHATLSLEAKLGLVKPGSGE